MKRLIFSLVIALTVLSCINGVFGEETATVAPEEYAVYTAVISSGEPLLRRDAVSEEAISPEQLVIEKATLTLKEITYADNVCVQFNNLAGIKLNDDLCSDFINKNQAAYDLENKFSLLGYDVMLISDEELSSLLAAEGSWDNFYQQYPDARGTIGLSRVGFNNERTHAFVCYNYSCGESCGRQILVLLFKKDGDWKIIRVQEIPKA
ncbi:MAG: hypothetical protein PHU91_04875 [Candidatus Omnitrophica bacterium]|nr:hypothetical protein [Candidatus Omnitrophota bacterium]MDD5236976.1 hypothetical protein [Candidatus Omnitrophota bacterium]MDD5610488.1 hypothetical protein [Candidatus Omnitrophota bacterium]